MAEYIVTGCKFIFYYDLYYYKCKMNYNLKYEHCYDHRDINYFML
jgi:hypothetical protein